MELYFAIIILLILYMNYNVNVDFYNKSVNNLLIGFVRPWTSVPKYKS